MNSECNRHNPYADIIDMPHHTSVYHRPMSVEARAAQFAPFAALPGHDEIIARRMRVRMREKRGDG